MARKKARKPGHVPLEQFGFRAPCPACPAEWAPAAAEIAALQAQARGAAESLLPYVAGRPFLVQGGKLLAQPGMPPRLAARLAEANQPGSIQLMAIDTMSEVERDRLAWLHGTRPAPGQPHAHHWVQAKRYGTTYCNACGLTIEQWGTPPAKRVVAWVPGTVWRRHPFFAGGGGA